MYCENTRASHNIGSALHLPDTRMQTGKQRKHERESKCYMFLRLQIPSNPIHRGYQLLSGLEAKAGLKGGL